MELRDTVVSKASKKGAGFERMVADYMARELRENIDRRVKYGAKDKGDIAGFSIGGWSCVVECKNQARMELSQWLDEAEAERENANASYGIVVHKRKGCGEARVGDTYVTMTLDTLLDIAWDVNSLC